MSKKPTATGKMRGNDLIVMRSFKAPIADVWESVTKSDRMERWFGRWEGDARVGNTIKLLMVFEKGDSWIDVTINKCEAPRHLDVTSKSDFGTSHYEITLREDGGTTHLEFVHHLTDAKKKMLGEFGPGWEYYFDMLVHSREGTPKPEWDDYYPAQKDYWLAQLETA